MTWTTDMYRKAAVTLWGVISLVLGLSVGAYFDLSDKKTLFVVIMVVGLYVIALLRWTKNAQGKISYPADNGRLSHLQENKEDHMESKINNNAEDKKTSDTETREWLDDFLVKQQKK